MFMCTCVHVDLRTKVVHVAWQLLQKPASPLDDCATVEMILERWQVHWREIARCPELAHPQEDAFSMI